MLIYVFSDEEAQKLMSDLSMYVANMESEMKGTTYEQDFYEDQYLGDLLELLDPKAKSLQQLRYLNNMLSRFEEDKYQENIDANKETVEELISLLEDDVENLLSAVYIKTMEVPNQKDVRDAWMRDRFGFNS